MGERTLPDPHFPQDPPSGTAPVQVAFDAVAAAGVGDGAAVVGRVGEAAGDDLRGGVVAERQAQIGGRSGQVVVEARQAGERVIAVGRRRAGARCVRASDLTVVGKGRGTGRATVVE